MKKAILISLRVIFFVGLMLGAAIFAARSYYQHQSKLAIDEALVLDGAPVMGDPDRPFTIVEFFDYRCPHCAAMSHLVKDAVGTDSQTKIILRPVVLREEESRKIAGLVLAADQQKAGASIALHTAIMDLPDLPTYAAVLELAEKQGLNVIQAEQDAQTYKTKLDANTALIQKIGFPRVPAVIIGDKGYAPLDTMPGINEFLLMVLDAKTRLHVIKGPSS